MPAEFTELDGHDAYDLLGLDPEASRQEIRRAYRALVKANHPDLFPESPAKAEAEEALRLLNAAHDALTARRAAYDAFRDSRHDEEDVVDEEVIDEDAIDDPWDTADPWHAADPGRPAADAPWRTAAFGPPPPRVRSPVPPPRMPPSPPPSRWGPPPTQPPPVRVRHPRRSQRRWGARPRPRGAFRRLPVRNKIAIACVLGVYGAVFVFLAGSVVSAMLTAPRPLASVPVELAGDWKGTVHDIGHGEHATWKAELILRAGKNNGEVRYNDGSCGGTAVPLSYKAGVLTMSTVFDKGSEGCDVGDVQVVRKKGRLNVSYHDGGGRVTASGTLFPR